jgi:hypothetical protein
MDSTPKISLGNIFSFIFSYVLGPGGGRKIGTTGRKGWSDPPANIDILTSFSYPNRSKTIKNGFYIENQPRKHL